MSSVSYSEYLAAQAAAQQAATERSRFADKPRVGFFSLRDDGDEALVRFAYSTPEEFEIYSAHSVTIDGKFRKVNCLRGLGEPAEKCPLCASGNRYSNRIYIKLVQYDRDENGSIVATPKIWERPASYANILANLFKEYGDISDCVFKVKRSGEKGSMQTTYSIMFGNPTIYSPQLYAKDFSAFEGYKVLGGPLMEKDYNGMLELVGDAKEVEVPMQTFTPKATVTSDELPFSNGYQGVTMNANPFAGGQKRVTY